LSTSWSTTVVSVMPSTEATKILSGQDGTARRRSNTSELRPIPDFRRS
jgi:hypothetical protein